LSRSSLIGISACVILSFIVTNNAYAHVMVCRPNDLFDENGKPIFRQICEAIDAGGYIERNNPAISAVTPYLTWIAFAAFIVSIGFGIFVLFKNRARKVVC
jgi:hypothetical protein